MSQAGIIDPVMALYISEMKEINNSVTYFYQCKKRKKCRLGNPACEQEKGPLCLMVCPSQEQ